MEDIQTAIGYTFLDGDLLAEALTTPSYRMDFPAARDNQRLEFLGDAALGLLAAERLYGEFPREQEGRLTVRRTHMVSAAALCGAAYAEAVESKIAGQLCKKGAKMRGALGRDGVP